MKVPTLVVVRNPDRLAKVCAALEQALPTHKAGDKLGSGVIQLLDIPGKEAEFQQSVETTTLPITVDKKKGWRIAVTTAIGARGQDYQISDEVVDDNGGLLLVLEYIPDSEREWIQFVGRTARHDHPGQYAVVLNRDEYKEALGTDASQEHQEVEKKVLDHINAITAKGLVEAEVQLDRGTCIHDNTANFWNWYVNSKASDQEKLDKYYKWVDLCEDFGDLTLESITGTFEGLRAGPGSINVLKSTPVQFRSGPGGGASAGPGGKKGWFS
jgi:hypothetical protein